MRVSGYIRTDLGEKGVLIAMDVAAGSVAAGIAAASVARASILERMHPVEIAARHRSSRSRTKRV